MTEWIPIKDYIDSPENRSPPQELVQNATDDWAWKTSACWKQLFDPQ
jgi:hypothetical protein